MGSAGSYPKARLLINILCSLDWPLPLVGIWQSISLLLLSLLQSTH